MVTFQCTSGRQKNVLFFLDLIGRVQKFRGLPLPTLTYVRFAFSFFFLAKRFTFNLE
jgi:hypothetical protein